MIVANIVVALIFKVDSFSPSSITPSLSRSTNNSTAAPGCANPRIVKFVLLVIASPTTGPVSSVASNQRKEPSRALASILKNIGADARLSTLLAPTLLAYRV